MATASASRRALARRPAGARPLPLHEAGSISSFSVGFVPREIRTIVRSDGVRLEEIVEGDLIEASIVLRPANKGAAATEVCRPVDLQSGPRPRAGRVPAGRLDRLSCLALPGGPLMNLSQMTLRRQSFSPLVDVGCVRVPAPVEPFHKFGKDSSDKGALRRSNCLSCS